MYRIFKPSKDCYIQERIIKNIRQTKSNTGEAATLDLFKIFGNVVSGGINQNELSRVLVKFDLDKLKALHNSGTIDITHSSFNCSLKLFDVGGGFPTPKNFKLILFPVSRSWDEGIGRDVVYYRDKDVCNFITASYDSTTNSMNLWNLSGCNRAGLANSSDIDIISSGALGTSTAKNLFVTQSFTTGFEDLNMDITQLVSATISGMIPDEGYRISFSGTLESNDRTYFVKRFASRHASNERFHPKLTVKFNDAIIDNSNNFTFDQSGTLFLYNYGYYGLSNLTSGSALTQITGTNSLVLWMHTVISGGFFSQSFTASQHQVGSNYVTGIYSSSLLLLSDNTHYKKKLLESGSVDFTVVWGSLDDKVGFLTSSLTVSPFQRTSYSPIQRNYVVNTTNIKKEYNKDEVVRVRLFATEDGTVPSPKPFPISRKSFIFNNLFWQIRDVITNEIIVPFDTSFRSTQCSTDTDGMYFDLYTDTLEIGRTYVIDVLLKEGTYEKTFKEVSQVFRISQ